MKKFLILASLMFFSLGLNQAQAQEVIFTMEQKIPEYDFLTGESTGTILEGTSFSKGNTDYILLPPQQYEIEKMSLHEISVSDPFVIKIDGVQYVILKDNKDGVWNEQDILGFYDTPELLFSSLVALNQNADTKLTPNELKNNNVRLAAVGTDGKLLVENTEKDFDLNKINYIDIKKLRKLANYTPDGVFGHFNVYLNDGRMIVGLVTFSESEHLKDLF